MDIAVKLTLIASVVLIGYSLSQLLTSFETECKKVQEFKDLAVENQSSDAQVRRSNFLLLTFLSTTYIVLAYVAGFDYWILGIIFLKLLLSGVASNFELNSILKNGSVGRGIFKMNKVDAFLNILLGVAVSLILVL